MVAVRYAAAHLLPKDKAGKEDRKAVGRSRSNYTRVHFKNTRCVFISVSRRTLAVSFSRPHRRLT